MQQYRTTHEVIVVNDNSTDETKYLLDEFKRLSRISIIWHLVQEAKMIPGKKFPLSMGIKAAKYEVVLLTDADCVPASEFWMQNAGCLSRRYSDRAWIWCLQKRGGLLNKLIRFETFHAALQYFFCLAGSPIWALAETCLIKRTVFNNRGFSSINHIPGGDDDLFLTAYYQSNTAIVVDHEAQHIK